MFWFKPLFQLLLLLPSHFNTSYVLVQVNNLNFLKSYLQNFNTSYVLVQANEYFKPLQDKLFQYIICFGSSNYQWKTNFDKLISIHHMFWFKLLSNKLNYWLKNFNTSYVLVQDKKRSKAT